MLSELTLFLSTFLDYIFINRSSHTATVKRVFPSFSCDEYSWWNSECRRKWFLFGFVHRKRCVWQRKYWMRSTPHVLCCRSSRLTKNCPLWVVLILIMKIQHHLMRSQNALTFLFVFLTLPNMFRKLLLFLANQSNKLKWNFDPWSSRTMGECLCFCLLSYFCWFLLAGWLDNHTCTSVSSVPV